MERRRKTRLAAVVLVGLSSALSWVGPRSGPRIPCRATGAIEGVEVETEESLLPELLELGAEGGSALEARIEEVFSQVSPDDLSALRM